MLEQKLFAMFLKHGVRAFQDTFHLNSTVRSGTVGARCDAI